MVAFDRLFDGYKTFRATTFDQHRARVRHIIEQGVKPSTLIITSSSLKIPLDVLFSRNVGELYVVRNIAGLIPIYNDKAAIGTVASIEYAVTHLNVENIVIVGNAHCAGVKSLMEKDVKPNTGDPITDWLSIGLEAKNAVLTQLKDRPKAEQIKAAEQEVLILSMRNLISYPFVAERLNNNRLNVYACYFDIETGDMFAFNPVTQYFSKIL